MKNIFDNDKFYVALLGDEVIAICAVSYGSCPIKLNKFSMYRYFWYKKGKLFFSYLENIFVKRDYGFEIDKECGMIEFLAVKEEYRNKKIGFTMINHIMHDNKYVRYLAKVGNNNYSALKVFDNVGFEEFDREQALINDYEGISEYLYLICQK